MTNRLISFNAIVLILLIVPNLGVVVPKNSQNNFGFLQMEANSECHLKKAVKKFSPIIYFDKKETTFPISIENASIDWSKIDFKDPQAAAAISISDPNWVSDAPMYVSIKENDESIQINYYLLFGATGCGGQKISFDATVGVGFLSSTNSVTYDVCPQTSADIQSLRYTLNKDMQNIVKIDFGANSSISADQIKLDGTHPVFYAALGSHNLYSSPITKNDILYSFFNSSSTFAKISLVYRDAVTTPAGNKFASKNLRVLKINNIAPQSGISTNEEHFAYHFSGVLGLNAPGFQIEDTINKIDDSAKTWVKKASSDLYNNLAANYQKIREVVVPSPAYGLSHYSEW